MMSAGFRQITIPWTGADGQLLIGGRNELVDAVGLWSDRFLVEDLEIVFEPGSSESTAKVFVQAVAAQLAREFSVWRQRLDELDASGLMGASEVAQTLMRTRSCQPWYIYVSTNGGLYDGEPLPEETNPDSPLVQFGAIPCTAAHHHGIAWWRTPSGRRSALVTSHREGSAWNWDEDIGHEAAHASFGPIPLFSQHFEAYGANTGLYEMWISDQAMTPELSARVHYILAELAVVSVRGEQRTTGTGLPGMQSLDELFLFLSIAHRFFPAAGFELVACAAREEGIPISVWSGPTIAPLRAAALRAAPVLANYINTTIPPPAPMISNLGI